MVKFFQAYKCTVLRNKALGKYLFLIDFAFNFFFANLPKARLNMTIDREQVSKVAFLARLELTPEEEQQFTTQLGEILDYFEQLNELDTSQVAPMTRAIELSNITRPDQLESYPQRDDILANAPEQEGDYFKVPKIMSEN
jgi:aspartyl-tRNA(Asn)/glutamyl-tRNA(Gln) amidotransferase subunit C